MINDSTSYSQSCAEFEDANLHSVKHLSQSPHVQPNTGLRWEWAPPTIGEYFATFMQLKKLLNPSTVHRGTCQQLLCSPLCMLVLNL